MLPFGSFFPKVAEAETRSIFLEEPGVDSFLPQGRYFFNEFYCVEPNCDCRRVMFFVGHEESKRIVARINFGFDRDDPMRGPFLDPLHEQAPFADEVLDLAKEYLLSDPAYVARLERHYWLVKSKDGPIDKSRMERLSVPNPFADAPRNRKASQKRLRQAMKTLKQRTRN